VERKTCGLVRDVPQEREIAETGGIDAVEEVVSGNDEKTERRENANGQMSESGEKNHAEAEHPENEEKDEGALYANLEHPQETDDGEFQQDEPEAAREEEARELRFGAAVLFVEKSTNACSECKNGRAEMRDPAGEEEGGGGAGEVGGIEGHGGGTDEVAHVVDRHDDHDEAAEGVDGEDAWLGERRVGGK